MLISWIREHQGDVSKLLFSLAGIYGIASVSLHPPQFGPPVEIEVLAANIAAHGSFANPFFVLQTGPTAAIPPLYPLVIAGLMKLLPSANFVYLVAVVGCILANAATAALLPRVSALFYGDIVPGVVASIFWVGTMPLIPSYDVSYTILGLLAFCLISSASVSGQRQAARSAILAGVVAAAVLLLNPSTLLILAPWVLFLLWRGSTPIRVRLISCGVISVLMALSIGGWCLRNYYRLGAFAVRTALGMTLYASNNDCAEVDVFTDQLSGCYDAHHPNVSLQEAELLRDLGEVRYDRMRIRDVKEWIYQHPRRFEVLTLKRIARFWFPPTLPSFTEMQRSYGDLPDQVRGWITHRNSTVRVIWLVTALSVPGLFLMVLKREPVSAYVLTVLGIYPLIYYIVLIDMRFRFPTIWLSLLPAGYFIGYLAEAGQRRRRADAVGLAATSEGRVAS